MQQPTHHPCRNGAYGPASSVHIHAERCSAHTERLGAQVPVTKIGLVIGPGGRTITGIREQTGCTDTDVRLRIYPLYPIPSGPC